MYRETPGSGNVQELLEEFWPLEGYGIINLCGIAVGSKRNCIWVSMLLCWKTASKYNMLRSLVPAHILISSCLLLKYDGQLRRMWSSVSTILSQDGARQ